MTVPRVRAFGARLVVALAATALALAAGAAAGPAHAQARNIFEVAGVQVDVTAETAAAARDRAIAEGEQKAFRRLLERLVVSPERVALPQPGRDELAPYIRDFSVAGERTSAVRYIASFTYRFRPEAVRRLLAQRGLAYSEQVSKQVVLLPVFRGEGEAVLWDEPNPWRAAWGAVLPRDGLVPIILPLGDLADIGAASAQQALTGDAGAVGFIADRYRAGGTVVASAALRPAGERGSEVEVAAHRFGGGVAVAPFFLTLGQQPGEASADLLRRAALAVVRHVEESWKAASTTRFGPPAVLAVRVPVADLGEWLRIRRRLEAVPAIRNPELVLLSRDEVRVNLWYTGEPEALRTALRQADLVLTRAGDEEVLSMAPTREAPR